MEFNSYEGIDYGNGKTNRNVETGIRFGVINQNRVLQAWADSSVPKYYDGDGNEVEEVGDFDEPTLYEYEEEGYKAFANDDGDIFITESPYFTYAQFCSPCAPGACYLVNPIPERNENNKCYCFGKDWFESEEEIPHPIYSVETGELVFPKEEE